MKYLRRGWITMNHTRWLSSLILVLLTISLAILADVNALPSGPVITYLSNSTTSNTAANRTVDAKGTITTVDVTATQQDYKWKAYVGNVTGTLVLDDANAKSIYDWSLGTITGEVYATRSSSSITWANVSCVNQSVITAEETALDISTTTIDSINTTFSATVHKSFLVGTKNITNSTCRAVATYLDDAAQASSEAAIFQEVLLRDDLNSALIYTALLEADQSSYDGTSTFDFQMIVAENESATTPQTYYFYVELG